MEPRITRPDALWRVYEAMDRFLSLLLIGPRAAGTLEPLVVVVVLLLLSLLLLLPLVLVIAPLALRLEDLAI
jgi:hypothetical protein